MQLIKSKKANINYLAKVVKIERFIDHPNPKCERLKGACVDGFTVWVNKSMEAGEYIYFPVGCQINNHLLSYANLYRHSELNKNDTEKGFFEDNGRVIAIRLQGEPSYGFLMPVVQFKNWIVEETQLTINCALNVEFDAFEHEDKEVIVCKKYLPKNAGVNRIPQHNRQKSLKGLDRVIENQFRFHYDTVLIEKVPHVIQPNDLISITEKIHGTSGISAHVLCNIEIPWQMKAVKWIEKVVGKMCGYDIEDPTDYDYLYSSRSVIKNRYYNKSVSPGFYECDVWKYADDYLKPMLPKGYTLYYEIVGYLPTGAYVQKDYDYGCVPPEANEKYTIGKHFKVRIYRVTETNVDGVVHEFSAREVQQWCDSHGLYAVKELYYGFAGELYPDIKEDLNWTTNFLNRLRNDKSFFMEEDSPSCMNKVPHEGIVIKRENSKSEAFKLKCFKFLGLEQKETETNIEDEA